MEVVKYKNRYDLLSFLPKNSVCAEFGVYTARFSYYLIKMTNPKKLYLIDPYWKTYGEKYWYNNVSTWEAFSKAVRVIKKHDINKCSTFVIDEDIKFLEGISDNLFDWVYLDSTHLYEDSLKELNIIKNKIKSNGLICGHDYRKNSKHKHHGVCKAINEWLEENKEYELYLLDNHTQWMIRKKNEKSL